MARHGYLGDDYGSEYDPNYDADDDRGSARGSWTGGSEPSSSSATVRRPGAGMRPNERRPTAGR